VKAKKISELQRPEHLSVLVEVMGSMLGNRRRQVDPVTLEREVNTAGRRLQEALEIEGSKADEGMRS
jgi:hypothetical protein